MSCDQDPKARLRAFMVEFLDELRARNGEPPPRPRTNDAEAELRIYLRELRAEYRTRALESRVLRIEDHLGLTTG